MQSNELKKGDKVRLKSGFNAVIMDNKKGGIRMAEVDGIVKEIGSIYVKDIAWMFKLNGDIEEIELTDKQKKNAEMINALGF
jgi:preprotein translocase subunit YajC